MGLAVPGAFLPLHSSSNYQAYLWSTEDVPALATAKVRGLDFFHRTDMVASPQYLRAGQAAAAPAGRVPVTHTGQHRCVCI